MIKVLVTLIALGAIAYSATMISTVPRSWRFDALSITSICSCTAGITLMWTSWIYERRERRTKGR